MLVWRLSQLIIINRVAGIGGAQWAIEARVVERIRFGTIGVGSGKPSDCKERLHLIGPPVSQSVSE